ncbi:hypothetical protein RSAG8_08631, partial [Rhizoctonia solani AG-8 WAC10335]
MLCKKPGGRAHSTLSWRPWDRSPPTLGPSWYPSSSRQRVVSCRIAFDLPRLDQV